MIRTEYEQIAYSPSSKEKRAEYISEDLGDKTFEGILFKYSAYRFEEHIQLLRDEFDCQSYSHISFCLEYEINGFSQTINLFCTTMEIPNREEIEYFINIGHEQIEVRKPLVNEILKNKYDRIFIKAIMNTKFYLNRSLDIENQYETEELGEIYDEGDDEGYGDNQPSPPIIETPFISDNCSIYLSAKPNIIIIPCLHQSVCSQCEEVGKLKNCPTCREKIERKIKI